jgi:hypothetical protein
VFALHIKDNSGVLDQRVAVRTGFYSQRLKTQGMLSILQAGVACSKHIIDCTSSYGSASENTGNSIPNSFRFSSLLDFMLYMTSLYIPDQ